MMRKSLLASKLLRGLAVVGPIVFRVALVVSLLTASLLFSQSAYAATIITSISPATATVGTLVTLVGTIDTNNGSFRVHWDSPTGEVVIFGTAVGTSVSTSFNLPAASQGTHTIYLEDVAATTVSAAKTVVITPLITLSPTRGPAGTTVTIYGTGFAANETGISATWDTTTAVATGKTANASGGWTATFTLPAGATTGAHTVDAFGATSTAATVPDVTFTIITPQITITPASGPIGTSVTVNGTGFGLGETGITVTYDGAVVKTAITASASGTWSTTFTVPSGVSGVDHPVDAGGPQTPATSITDQNFTILPTVLITPSTGAVGTQATVSGNGFRASETGISITLDGTAMKTDVTATVQGTWTASVVIPESPGGTRAIDASSASTPATTVTDTVFTITPRIAVSPSSGSTGTQVTVTGSGFGASEIGIVVTFAGAPVREHVSANARGGWTVTFAVPATTGGARIVDAHGATTPASAVPDFSFSVAPKIVLSPSQEAVGARVTVNGTSFSPSETGIAVTYDGAIVASGIVATASGDWVATFNVPPSATGNHRVGSYGNATAAASVPEMTFAIMPTLTVSPTTGFAGMQVPVNGNGFAAGKTISITYDGSPVVSSPGVVTSSAQGSFSASFTIPRSKSGLHKLRIGDGTTTREIDWTMESTSPPAPAVASPGQGQKVSLFGRVPITFQWSAVTDPSGVYYSLQVSTTPDFAAPLIKQDNLASPTYTTSADETLPMGTFFWRVKAVDGAGNESAWTVTADFNVGIMPVWTFVAIIIVVVALIAGIVVLVRRRGSGEDQWWRA